MYLELYGYVVMLSTYTFVLFTVCKHVSTVLEATKSCTRKMMNDDICLKRVLEVVCYGVHVKKKYFEFYATLEESESAAIVWVRDFWG